MKSFQFFLVNTLTVIIALGLVSGAFATKRNEMASAPLENLPKIQVQKLGKYRGQYLTVFYGKGSRPLFADASHDVKLAEIKETRTVYIANDYANLPELALPKQSAPSAYNLVVFAISPAPGFTWPPTNDQRAFLVSSFSKDDIESLSIGQGLEHGLVLTLE